MAKLFTKALPMNLTQSHEVTKRIGVSVDGGSFGDVLFAPG